MTPAFNRARWRMVAWSMSVVTILMVSMGVLIYESTTRSLMHGVDTLLSVSASAAQAELEKGEIQGELLQEGYRAGLFYLVLSPDGIVVSNPQLVAASDIPSLLTSDSTAGPRLFTTTTTTTTSASADEVRAYSQPVRMTTGQVLILIVGQSLAPVQAASRQLALTLLIGFGIGLLLSLAGAWFLAARALAPIQRAFERQQEFVADASHELRTPLTILHSSADFLIEQALQRQVDLKAALGEMLQEIVRMERLTRDLLTLARSDRGELHLALGSVNLGALADELMLRVAVLGQARNVQLQRGEMTPATVEADPDRLQEVGLIVLDNALKYTPPGGSVWVSVRHEPPYGVLQIDDSGEGIPPEHLERVFERFHRVDRSRSRETGGAGLGLAIAHSLVTAHAGRLSVGHRPGGGTRVRIMIPLAASAEELVAADVRDRVAVAK